MDVQTLLPDQSFPRTALPSARPPLGRRVVGAFYLVMGGIHLGVVAADPETYRGFADAALFHFVAEGWSSIFMAHPSFWGLFLMTVEITLGVLLLNGSRAAARLGWTGVIGFHVLLLPFGFWLWFYAVPALAILIWLAHRDLGRSVR